MKHEVWPPFMFRRHHRVKPDGTAENDPIFGTDEFPVGMVLKSETGLERLVVPISQYQEHALFWDVALMRFEIFQVSFIEGDDCGD